MRGKKFCFVVIKRTMPVLLTWFMVNFLASPTDCSWSVPRGWSGGHRQKPLSKIDVLPQSGFLARALDVKRRRLPPVPITLPNFPPSSSFFFPRLKSENVDRWKEMGSKNSNYSPSGALKWYQLLTAGGTLGILLFSPNWGLYRSELLIKLLISI